MKTSSAKAKGRKLQKTVCQKIADAFGVDYDQQDDNCAVHSREMGQSGTDIILRGELFTRIPFDIECKNTEKVNLYKFIEQAKQNTKPGREWLVVHKKNFSNPVAIMEFDVFLDLLRRAKC